MKSLKRLVAVVALVNTTGFFVTPFTANAEAADGPTINQIVVDGSVKDVLQKITKMVADNGMMVMGEIHQGKILAMTGLKIESESIFVGNPTMGKKLFSAELGIGQVVPVRLNIYKNADGKTVVSYFTPSSLVAGYNNPKLDEMGAMLDKKLGKMTGMLKM